MLRTYSHVVRGVLVAAVAIWLAGCVPVERLAPPVDSRMAEVGGKNGVHAEALQHGRDLYLARCTRCHNPMRIDRYSVSQWQGDILPDMSKRAKLNADETADLSAYVLAAHEAMAKGLLNAPAPAGAATPR